MSTIPRLQRFLRRHRWSISLFALSTLSFLRLASEIREGELGAFDEAVAGAFAGVRGRFDGPMLALTQSGGFVGMSVLCVASVFVLFKLRMPREAAFVAACGTGALIFVSALKLFFHRVRPGSAALYLLETPSSFSFPSGHAMGSMTVVGSLAIVAYGFRRAWPWRVATSSVALLYVFGVAASRVYFGVHFPSDVIGGCLAGAAWVALLTGWFYPRLLPGEASGASGAS